jgi:hypothetical protein
MLTHTMLLQMLNEAEARRDDVTLPADVRERSGETVGLADASKGYDLGARSRRAIARRLKVPVSAVEITGVMGLQQSNRKAAMSSTPTVNSQGSRRRRPLPIRAHVPVGPVGA